MLLELAVGAAVGLGLSSLVGPSVIGWWYEPPSKDAFSCAGSVRTALAQFVTMQLASAGVGGVGLIGLSLLFRRAATQRAAARPE